MSDLWSASRNHEIFWWNQDELGESNGANYFLRRHLYFHTFFSKYFIIFGNISITANTVLYEKKNSWKHKCKNASIYKSTYVSICNLFLVPPKPILTHLIIAYRITFHTILFRCKLQISEFEIAFESGINF